MEKTDIIVYLVVMPYGFCQYNVKNSKDKKQGITVLCYPNLP